MDIANANHLLYNFKTVALVRNFKLLMIINAHVFKGNIRLDFRNVKIAHGHAQLAAKMAF